MSRKKLTGVEGVDYVICQVCKRRFRSITHKHLKHHNMTTDEYKKKYPNNQLTRDITKNKHSKSRINFLNNNPEALHKLKTVFLGKKHTKETKKLLSIKNTGRLHTEEEILKMKKSEIDVWLNKNQNKYLCECGCGEIIKLERRHYPNIPKFIWGHNTKTEEFKVGARIRGKEGIQKLIDASELYWNNEENCKRRSEEVTQYYIDNPEKGDQHSQLIIEQWNNLTKEEKVERSKRQSAGHQHISYDEWDHFLCEEDNWRDWSNVIYLNDIFPGCHRHHITKTIIVCIPGELHEHISHNLKTGRNMAEINMLALQFINGCYND